MLARDVASVLVTCVAVAASIASDPASVGAADVPPIALSSTEPTIVNVVVEIGARRLDAAVSSVDTDVFLRAFVQADAANAELIDSVTATLFALDEAERGAELAATVGDTFAEGGAEDALLLSLETATRITDCAFPPCERRFELELVTDADAPPDAPSDAPFDALVSFSAFVQNNASQGMDVTLDVQ